MLLFLAVCTFVTLSGLHTTGHTLHCVFLSLIYSVSTLTSLFLVSCSLCSQEAEGKFVPLTQDEINSAVAALSAFFDQKGLFDYMKIVTSISVSSSASLWVTLSMFCSGCGELSEQHSCVHRLLPASPSTAEGDLHRAQRTQVHG